MNLVKFIPTCSTRSGIICLWGAKFGLFHQFYMILKLIKTISLYLITFFVKTYLVQVKEMIKYLIK